MNRKSLLAAAAGLMIATPLFAQSAGKAVVAILPFNNSATGKANEELAPLSKGIADMMIETYNAESTLLRVIKLTDTHGEATASVQTDIMRTYLYDAADRIGNNAKSALNSFAEGDELKMMHLGIKRFIKTEPFNSKAARRRIADKMIEKNGYCF